MIAIIYAKIIDEKKNGIILDGPFWGPMCSNMNSAHIEAKKITDSSDDLILIRIYPLDKYSHDKIMTIAKSCFTAIYQDMASAKVINEKSTFKVMKKKKKLLKKKAAKLEAANAKLDDTDLTMPNF